jgi:hypothetical protein
MNKFDNFEQRPLFLLDIMIQRSDDSLTKIQFGMQEE